MSSERLDLDELERLEREATPGPWRVPVANVFRVVHPRVIDGEETSEWDDVVLCDPQRNRRAHHDARLIAAVRNVLPALIAELRQLRSEVAS